LRAEAEDLTRSVSRQAAGSSDAAGHTHWPIRYLRRLSSRER
jgi:hypothetical protein